MTIGEIVGLAFSVVISAYSVISTIIMACKNKDKAKATTILGILANVPNYVGQAESIFGKGNGQAKFQWVLNKIQIDAVKSNVDITEDQVKKQVEIVLDTPQKKDVTRTDIQN